MKPVRLFSPTTYRVALGLGSALFIGLLLIAWTSDTAEVGLDWKFKLRLTAAAFILGGGVIGWAVRYKRSAEAEERTRQIVRENLSRR